MENDADDADDALLDEQEGCLRYMRVIRIE